KRESRIGTSSTVQDRLEIGQRISVDLGRVDREGRSRLEVIPSVDGSRGDLPAEGDRLGRVIDRVVRLLRRCREGAVDQVQLVPVIRPVDVVTDTSPVRQTEGPTRLLADRDARNRVGGTIALAELLRIRERLDRAAE